MSGRKYAMVVARGWPKQPGKKGPATGCPACAVPLFFFSVAMLSMIYFFCDLNLAMSRQQTLDNMGCMVNTVVITVLSRCCHFLLIEEKNIMVKNTRRQYLQLCQLYDGFCNFLMFLYCLLFRTCFRIVYLNDNFILAIDHRFGRFLQVYISCIKFVFGCFWLEI